VAAEKANPVKPKTAAPANTPEATVQSNSKGVMTCLRFLRGFATATGKDSTVDGMTAQSYPGACTLECW